jgi:hypothetical protein
MITLKRDCTRWNAETHDFSATFRRSAGTLTSSIYMTADSSCGPGVLENYAVLPAQTHHLHLLFRP